MIVALIVLQVITIGLVVALSYYINSRIHDVEERLVVMSATSCARRE